MSKVQLTNNNLAVTIGTATVKINAIQGVRELHDELGMYDRYLVLLENDKFVVNYDTRVEMLEDLKKISDIISNL